MITKKELIEEFGFKELPHFTVHGALVLDLGRRREITFSCVESANETLLIGDRMSNGKYECVVLSSYDYDGFITKERLKLMIDFFNTSPYKTKQDENRS